MRRVFISLGIVAAVLLGALAGGGYWLNSRYTQPGPLKLSRTVIVERGAGAGAIANLLKRDGVISDALVFRFGYRFFAESAPLRAGEYAFPAAVSIAGAIRVLQSGDTVVHKVTIAEGITVRDVLETLRATEGLSGAITEAPEEGSLLPETYHFSRGDKRVDMIRRMARNLDQTLSRLWALRADGLPLRTPREAAILASIVEKETAVPAERARVAAVFVNRLRKGMRLQSDPTVVYGLSDGRGRLARPLSRADLKKETPFNTYVIKGLPPAPIANAGRDSLMAVMHPADTDELYFVADGSGGHVFAKTLKEHNRNVARWRKLRRERSTQSTN